MEENSKLIRRAKKVFVIASILYALLLHILVALSAKNQGQPVGVAIMSMGLTLVVVWTIIGGLLQRSILKKKFLSLTTIAKRPILHFALFATTLACIEEAITVSITNLAPLYGVKVGQAYITASTNYFDVIFFHSIIVFVPMFFVLGSILKRYDISPFKAFLLWGIVGVFAESTFAGPQAFLAAPSWIFVYGLMVYLPAYSFINTPRKKPFFLLYPLFVIMILLGALATFWIPVVLKHPSVHFQPTTLTT